MLNAKTKTFIYSFFTILPGIIGTNAFAIGDTSQVTTNVTSVTRLAPGAKTKISANGRVVAFNTNQQFGEGGVSTLDIFLYDKVSKKTTKITDASTGYKRGSSPSLSADGRYVAFVSTVPCEQYLGGINPYLGNVTDVLLYDNQTNTTTCVSKISGGILQKGNSTSPSISADGRYIAYTSTSGGLIPGDSGGGVYVYDRITKQNSLVNVSSNGIKGNAIGLSPSISADGHFVTFVSPANNLVDNDTNKKADVFVHDRLSKQTSLVSMNSAGGQSNNYSVEPSISADGRYVTYLSYADNLVDGDNNNSLDVFVHDRTTKTTSRVSVSTGGTEGNAHSSSPNISADGRYISFESLAENLVPGANTSSTKGIYIHDRTTKQTTRASVSDTGAGGDRVSIGNSLSADGNYVSFWSYSDNLVENDTNNSFDVFIRDRNINSTQLTDVLVTATQKPLSLIQNGQGDYVFTIANNGTTDIKNLRLAHIISNGQLITISPSLGTCKPFASISLCSFTTLTAGSNVTLSLTVKVGASASLNQQISLLSGADDPKPTNNYLNVATPVTP